MFTPKRMHLSICSAPGHEDVVKELYGDHGFIEITDFSMKEISGLVSFLFGGSGITPSGLQC